LEIADGYGIMLKRRMTPEDEIEKYADNCNSAHVSRFFGDSVGGLKFG
jgi:hypothetical protein